MDGRFYEQEGWLMDRMIGSINKIEVLKVEEMELKSNFQMFSVSGKF